MLDSDIMKEAFSTTEGKLIFNGVIESITGNVIAIVNICRTSPPDEAKEKVMIPANEISMADKLLRKWATIMAGGDRHKEKIK